MDKAKLLDRIGAEGEDRHLLAKILDRSQQAEQRGIPTVTDFLSPQQQRMAKELLRLSGVADTSYATLGGYEGAERMLLMFLPDWLEADAAAEQCPIRCLRVSFRAEDGLNHRDLLGSLMGLGIVREKLGDILVCADSADLIVLDTVAEFLLQNWSSAGRAHLSVREVEPENLHIPQQRVQEIRDTVSSLRLDSILSTGFRMARGKAAELVASGRVQVNWQECTKSDKLLSAGDVISARGFGKMELSEVGGLTKKGRIAILVKRYL